jgi:hypothetical protein
MTLTYPTKKLGVNSLMAAFTPTLALSHRNGIGMGEGVSEKSLAGKRRHLLVVVQF